MDTKWTQIQWQGCMFPNFKYDDYTKTMEQKLNKK